MLEKKTWADIRSAGKVSCGNDVTRFDAAKDDAERTVYRKQRNRRWPPSPFQIEERALARVASLSELDAAVAALVQQRVAALFVAPQADFRNWRQQILALAERNALPTSFSNSDSRMRHVTKMAMTTRSTRRAPCYGACRRDPVIRIVIILMIAKALYNHCPIDDRHFPSCSLRW